jgi:thiol-disulfide isomerase/thioredoxin
MRKQYLLPFALILMVVLAACSGGQTAEVSQAEAAAVTQDEAAVSMDEGHDDDMDDMDEESHGDDMDDMEGEEHDDDMDSMEGEGHDDDMDEESHNDDMDDMEGEDHDDGGEMVEESMAAAGLPAWQTIALTNAVSGEKFSLGDFQGKTVFVEPMATWCSNCRSQQGHVSQAKTQLGDDVVFVGLSLETNLPSEQLASYAQGNGFDWTYAVMPVELLAELTDEFGRSITSAPSTPHFIIRPDGSYSELATGIHSAGEIVSEIQAEQG